MKRLLIAGILISLTACADNGSEAFDFQQPMVTIGGEGVSMEAPTLQISPIGLGLQGMGFFGK